jgi:hypothetical protein
MTQQSEISRKGPWIEWNGSEWDRSPVADGRHIEVRFRNGCETDLEAPEMLRWDHLPEQADCDIIAYRIVQGDQA